MSRKTLTIQIRVSPDEHAGYTAKARAVNMTVSEWMRAGQPLTPKFHESHEGFTGIIPKRSKPAKLPKAKTGKPFRTFFKDSMKVKP